MNRKKIMSALAAGLVFGSMIAVPISSYAAEAVNDSGKVLNVKSTAETYVAQGEKLFAEGKYEESAILFEKAAKEAKNNDEYWADCGAAYYMAESYQHATECFEKAIELNPSHADYWRGCGQSWLQRGIQSSQDKSRMVGFGKPIWDFFRNACSYLDRAVTLAPNDPVIQYNAGRVAEISGNYAKVYGIRRQSSPKELYQKAYNRYRKAVELDHNNETAQNDLSIFLKIHPEYGSQPSAQGAQGQSSAPTGDLNAEAVQIQKWLQEGKIKAYNAGAGFEWWDEKAKAEFEALPFSNDLAEVCSHVYRFTRFSAGEPSATYCILVPRHVRISYGGGEYETFDSLVMVNIASKYYDSVDRKMVFESFDDLWDNAYIKNGRIHFIVYLPLDDTPPLDWQQLKSGQEVEQRGGVVNTLGVELTYTFEGTNNPNSFILHGYYSDREAEGPSERDLFEALPGITLPTLFDANEE